MNSSPSPVKVTIFGSEYTIKGKADEEYIQKLAGYINEKMTEISNSTNLSNVLKISILAGINLADEIFRLRQNSYEQPADNDDQILLQKPSGIAPEAISALSAHIEVALQEKANNLG